MGYILIPKDSEDYKSIRSILSAWGFWPFIRTLRIMVKEYLRTKYADTNLQHLSCFIDKKFMEILNHGAAKKLKKLTRG